MYLANTCSKFWPKTLLSRAQEAIASVGTGQGVVVDPAVEQQAQLWMEGLLAEDRVRLRLLSSSCAAHAPTALTAIN
jgi:hypothetical protein